MKHIDGMQPFRRGQQLKADDLNAIMRAAKALEAAMPGFNEGDTRAFGVRKHSPNLRWVRWENRDTQQCPPYGVIQPTTFGAGARFPLKGDYNRSYEGKRPHYAAGFSTKPPWYLVNSSVEVPAGRVGWATFLFEPGLVLASEPPRFRIANPNQYSEMYYGVEEGSWALVSQRDGQFILLGALEDEQNVIIAYQTPNFDAFCTVIDAEGSVEDGDVFLEGFYTSAARYFNILPDINANEGTLTALVSGTYHFVASCVIRSKDGYTNGGSVPNNTDLQLRMFKDDTETNFFLSHTLQRARKPDNNGSFEIISRTSVSGIISIAVDEKLKWKNVSGFPIEIERYYFSIACISPFHNAHLY